MVKTKKGKEYWYKRYVGECPLCGRDASYVERVYGKKPTNKKKVYIQMSYQETYCGCGG